MICPTAQGELWLPPKRLQPRTPTSGRQARWNTWSHGVFIRRDREEGFYAGRETPRDRLTYDYHTKTRTDSRSKLERNMGEVIRFVSKYDRERIRLIQEARARYESVFPSVDAVNDPHHAVGDADARERH